MTEFHVDVVRLGEVRSHPNADRLEITNVHGGYPCILRKGDFKEGDLAVYIPIDTVLPNTERFAFLSDSDRKRLRAKKLRGIFSMGLIISADEDMNEGDDVAERLGIERYEPPEPLSTGGECEAAPQGWFFPHYTDIEGLRRYGDVLTPGEEVVVTEKIHGANGRYVHDGERLWVGSRTQIKKQDPESIWWKAAEAACLEARLARYPMKVFFGEVFGQVQDLKYGVKRGVDFRLFDIFDLRSGQYLDHYDCMHIARELGIPWVPILHQGPWDPIMANSMCEGTSTLDGADNVREGFVVKPVVERFDERVGRVILKMHGQGYLLRKGK